jgi:CheY-like chemotaxis protein
MAEPKAKQPETEEPMAGAKKSKPSARRAQPAERPVTSAGSGPARPAAAAGSATHSSAAPSALPARPSAAAPEASGERTLSTAEILAASSEEFRDSLQTIRGALELLVAGKVPDEQKAGQFLQIAYRATGYLSHRVSDLHVASLIETDRLRLKLTTLNLGPMLDHQVQEIAAVAADQEITVDLQAQPDLPTLQGDEALLRMTLTNMLETALKSTPRQGSVQVQASSGEDQITIRVESRARQENGEGDGPGLQAAEGQSLALFVAQRIALAHEGNLETLDAGSETQGLELILPLQPKAHRRGRILVVDDNPQAAFLLEYALQEEGYEPVKAMNGPDALKLARSERFDLIILDVLLPGIDGFEVCHRLRAAPETASVPIIMVSAKAREEDMSTALRIGADAYFGKPLGMAELAAAISDLLEAGDSRASHGDRRD